ncbi:MAG TPA: hypothetical protein VG944_16120 [Fimbriimonas sp.]|nr:hypothetical protein [Fimbriimonas sp.]
MTKANNLVRMRTDALTKEEIIPLGSLDPYNAAAAHRQKLGLELDLGSKLKVLDNLRGVRPRIDFSGGDVLTVSDNFAVLQQAASLFGCENITLTATGAGLARVDPESLKGLIGEFNFSFDGVDGENPHRPSTYAKSNLSKAKAIAATGITTRAECPLNRFNCEPEVLTRLYEILHEANVSKLLPMRLFPVGRGELKAADIPTIPQYKSAISTLRALEAKYGTPRVKLQCALRMLENEPLTENPCDLVRESFGLMADGTLLASPWAVGGKGRPLDETFVLGNLAATAMADILRTEKAKEFMSRRNENFGHCKIFAFLNSKKSAPMDRIFDNSDPLYIQAGAYGAAVI